MQVNLYYLKTTLRDTRRNGPALVPALGDTHVSGHRTGPSGTPIENDPRTKP